MQFEIDKEAQTAQAYEAWVNDVAEVFAAHQRHITPDFDRHVNEALALIAPYTQDKAA